MTLLIIGAAFTLAIGVTSWAALIVSLVADRRRVARQRATS